MSVVMSLDVALTPTHVSEGQFSFSIPAGFGQGKATFGGLVLGGMARAMTMTGVPVTRRLRSLQAQLVGAPAVGETTIAVRVLRQTGSMITIAAELSQGGQLCCHAVAIFADKRNVDLQWRHIAAPAAPRWQDVDAVDMDNPFAPEFTANFVFRPIRGYPFSGAAPQTLGYIQPRVACEVLDDGFIAAMIDAWWLAAFVGVEAPRPAATLTFSAELHDGLEGLDRAQPLLHRGDSLTLSEGFSTETRELWGHDGRLVATNRQLVTIIK
jgi:acyl-CoA thioesterase